MKKTNTEVYHFIGLGGIGMSALARILMQQGTKVQGSDSTASSLLEQLKAEGALTCVGHNTELIKKATTVVYSSAIKNDNIELAKAKELGIPIFHRSDLLNLLIEGKKNLLVTGSHGKTITSALLAWVLSSAGYDPTFAIGGLLLGSNTNGKFGKGNYCVVEADESDGSFLKSGAFGAIITNLNNDHMDYWQQEEMLNIAFRQFFTLVTPYLFWCYDDKKLHSLAPPGISYGFSSKADLKIEGFTSNAEGIYFDVIFNQEKTSKIYVPLKGQHNALNAAAVFGLALQLKIPEMVIRKAFESFLGVKRRLELIGEARKVKIFDDYAHHPTEIIATLKALRSIVFERRLIVVFQPHRYTRVRDLYKEFLFCFDDADLVILTDIYGAGEDPIEGITTLFLYDQLKTQLKDKLCFLPRLDLEEGVVAILKPLDTVITIGAGDITRSAQEILRQWESKKVKIRVGLLYGGTSVEHAISILSAKTIGQNLNGAVYDVYYFGITKEGTWVKSNHWLPTLNSISLNKGVKFSEDIFKQLSVCEVCIPVFHGNQGEDGMVQGLLDTLQIPYVGSDYRSSAICMHKGWAKRLAITHGIPTAPFLEMWIGEYKNNPLILFQQIEELFTYPVWIKPVHLGSSIGLTCANNRFEAEEGVKIAYRYDDCIIVEPHILGRQIEFGVIGNDYIQVGMASEILNENGAFVSYNDKYGSNALPFAIPARLSKDDTARGIALAKKIYLAAGCQGLARIDFFIDNDHCFWLNELHPFPGCTETSAFPNLWAASGMSMEALCDHLIALAFHRTRKLNAMRESS